MSSDDSDVSLDKFIEWLKTQSTEIPVDYTNISCCVQAEFVKSVYGARVKRFYHSHFVVKCEPEPYGGEPLESRVFYSPATRAAALLSDTYGECLKIAEGLRELELSPDFDPEAATALWYEEAAAHVHDKETRSSSNREPT